MGAATDPDPVVATDASAKDAGGAVTGDPPPNTPGDGADGPAAGDPPNTLADGAGGAAAGDPPPNTPDDGASGVPAGDPANTLGGGGGGAGAEDRPNAPAGGADSPAAGDPANAPGGVGGGGAATASGAAARIPGGRPAEGADGADARPGTAFKAASVVGAGADGAKNRGAIISPAKAAAARVPKTAGRHSTRLLAPVRLARGLARSSASRAA